MVNGPVFKLEYIYIYIYMHELWIYKLSYAVLFSYSFEYHCPCISWHLLGVFLMNSTTLIPKQKSFFLMMLILKDDLCN